MRAVLCAAPCPQSKTQGPCALRQFREWMRDMRADPSLTKEYRQFCEVSAWRVRAPYALVLDNWRLTCVGRPQLRGAAASQQLTTGMRACAAIVRVDAGHAAAPRLRGGKGYPRGIQGMPGCRGNRMHAPLPSGMWSVDARG